MSADQLTLGEQLRDAGMAAALENAGEVWRGRARGAVMGFISMGRVFSAEDVRRIAGDPPSANAIGGLFGTMAREGLIREYDRVKPERASRHASKITRWIGARAA